MGYSINYAKGNTSYPVLVENDPDYVLISAVYHREKRTIGTLIFKLLDNHPSFSVFEKFKGVVHLDFNGVRLFDARIYNVKKDINNIKTVECEGLLGFLNDSVIAPYTFNRNSRIFVNAQPSDNYSIRVRDYITDLLNEHNSQVAEEQRVFLTNNTDSSILNTEISTEGSGYSTAWDELTTNVLNNYGGDVDLDLSQSDTKLKFFDAPSSNVAQEIRYGINLKSIELSYNDDFATAVYPVSEYVDDNKITHKINIGSVNGGNYFIINQTAAASYGRINKVVNIKGATNPTDLYNLALAQLNEMSRMRVKTTLSAIDMSELDASYMPIKTGQLIRAVSEPNDISFTAEVTAFDADIIDPGKSMYTINGKASAFTQLLKSKL